MAFLKKYELEVTDLVSALNRCQNPLYLKFAEAGEQLLKELVNGYVPKFFKSGLGTMIIVRCRNFFSFLVWKETGNDVVLPLQFSVFGSQVRFSRILISSLFLTHRPFCRYRRRQHALRPVWSIPSRSGLASSRVPTRPTSASSTSARRRRWHASSTRATRRT